MPAYNVSICMAHSYVSDRDSVFCASLCTILRVYIAPRIPCKTRRNRITGKDEDRPRYIWSMSYPVPSIAYPTSSTPLPNKQTITPPQPQQFRISDSSRAFRDTKWIQQQGRSKREQPGLPERIPASSLRRGGALCPCKFAIRSETSQHRLTKTRHEGREGQG